MKPKMGLPENFARAPLPERLRFFANAQRVVCGSAELAADLEEAATEIELGQRTPLTYRGGKRGGIVR